MRRDYRLVRKSGSGKVRKVVLLVDTEDRLRAQFEKKHLHPQVRVCGGKWIDLHLATEADVLRERLSELNQRVAELENENTDLFNELNDAVITRQGQ